MRTNAKAPRARGGGRSTAVDLNVAQLAGSVRVQPVPSTQLLWSQSPIPIHRGCDAATSSQRSSSAERGNANATIPGVRRPALQRRWTALRRRYRRTSRRCRSQECKDSDPTELDRLQRDLTQRQTTYAEIARSYEDVRLAEARQMDTSSWWSCRCPSSPYGPDHAEHAHGAVSRLIALALVFLKEYLDDTVKTPEDVERICGFSTLGAIARMPERRAHPRSARVTIGIAEAYRALRTNISFSGVDHPLSTLLVTSARPAKGRPLRLSTYRVLWPSGHESDPRRHRPAPTVDPSSLRDAKRCGLTRC